MLALCPCACVDLSTGIYEHRPTYVEHLIKLLAPFLIPCFSPSLLPLLLLFMPLDSPLSGNARCPSNHFFDVSCLYLCFNLSISHGCKTRHQLHVQLHPGCPIQWAAVPGVAHRTSCGKLACYGPHPSWLQTPTAHLPLPSPPCTAAYTSAQIFQCHLKRMAMVGQVEGVMVLLSRVGDEGERTLFHLALC